MKNVTVGKKTPMRQRRTPDEINEMRKLATKMRAEGSTLQEIGDAIGISKTGVWIYLPAEDDDNTREAAMRMRSMRNEEGMNNSEIAEIMGISRQRVAQVLGPIGEDTLASRVAGLREVRLPVEAIPVIREKARELGYINTRGVNAMEGSIPLLIRAIANGEIALIRMRGARNSPVRDNGNQGDLVTGS